jgi:hypothetical protein
MSKVHAKKTSSFGVSINENSKYNTAGITIDATLAAKYPDSVVEAAKKLKAKHKDRFSDEYYLNYAKSQGLRKIQGIIGAIHKKNSETLPVQDIAWAAYSYEEILQMENDGYNIPEDVLLWAHAQQQSDVTDYIVVSEATDSADSSNTEDATGADELSQLQKVAKENIVKVDDALDKSADKKEEYKEAALIANFVKRKNQNSYQEKMQKIESDAKEWKRLDDKKSSGTKLSLKERLKYATLSKKLLSSESAATADVERDNTRLESYLETLDGIQKDIEVNTQLATDTIQSGKDLSKYEQQYQEEKTPSVTSGVRFDGSGLTSDSLYDIPNSDVASLAVEKGDELNQDVQSVSEKINSSHSLDLAQFAQSYVTLAEEINESKNQIMFGDETEDSDEEGEDSQETEKSTKSSDYSVDMSFTDKNSQKATTTTLTAIASMVMEETVTIKSEKTLLSSVKKVQNDMKKAQKEATKAESQHNINVQKENDDIAQLELLQLEEENGATTDEQNGNNASIVSQQVQTPTRAAGVTQNSESTQEEGSKETTSATSTSDDKTSEKESYVQDISTIENEDGKVQTGAEKAVNTAKKSNKITSRLHNILKGYNQDLNKKINNTAEVSATTLAVGIGTVLKSPITQAVGASTQAAGTAMLPSPITHVAGVLLVAEGTALIEQSIRELQYGTLAAVTGGIGLVATAIASATSSSAIKSDKQATNSIKDTNKDINEINKSLDNQETADLGSVLNENQNSTGDKDINSENTTTDLEENNQNTLTENVKNEEEVVDNTQNNNTSETTNETDNTGETLESSDSSETSESTETTNTTEEDNNSESTKNSDSDSSISLKFTYKNAKDAAKITDAATRELIAQRSSTENKATKVEKDTKNSKRLIRKIEKEIGENESKHQENLATEQELNSQILSLNSTANAGENSDESIAAQAQAQELFDILNATLDKDNTVSENSNSVINADTKQLAQYQKNTVNLQENIGTLKSLSSAQLELSAKTIIVGAGTTYRGVSDISEGINSISTGTPLMASPFTYAQGLAQVISGTVNIVKGTLETTSGAEATISGTEGVIENVKTEKAISEANSDIVKSDEQTQSAMKSIQKAVRSVAQIQGESVGDVEDEMGDVAENTNDKSNEEDNNTEDITLAAAATIGVESNTLTTTDENNDKKLSRFNSDSMIHSRKKNKRVLGVFAAMTNKKGKH